MNDKIKRISDYRQPQSIEEALKHARQRIRNNGASDLEEPEGSASGDMETFLENFGSKANCGDDT